MIYTKATTLTVEMTIWARAKSAYERQPGDEPFGYSAQVGKYHYDKNAILVITLDIQLDVPAGIDLYAKAMDTLEGQEKEALREYNEKVNNISATRKAMLMLSAPVAVDEGEYLPAQRVDDDDIPY